MSIYPQGVTVKDVFQRYKGVFQGSVKSKESGIGQSYNCRFLLRLGITSKNDHSRERNLVALLMNPSTADEHYADPTTSCLLDEVKFNGNHAVDVFTSINIINVIPLVEMDNKKQKEWLNEFKDGGGIFNPLSENITLIRNFITSLPDFDLLLATGDIKNNFSEDGVTYYESIMNLIEDNATKIGNVYHTTPVDDGYAQQLHYFYINSKSRKLVENTVAHKQQSFEGIFKDPKRFTL